MSKESNSRRISNRQPKRKKFDEDKNEDLPTNGKVRSCDKAGCIATEPTCCLRTNEFCAESGYTSRWYHMSLSEHFCNNCFDHFYRPSKGGNLQFNQWSHEWGSVAKASKPTLKCFVANELLPYWLKCTQRNCGKWRKVTVKDIDPTFIKTFKCQKSELKTCDAAEDNDVALVLDSTFMSQMAEKALLKNSPAAPYLKRFLAEDIGVCPIQSNESPLEDQKYIEPFLMEQCGESPIWVKPGVLDEDELQFAKQVDISPPTYLGLRNFLVAIWNLTPSEWLSVEKIHPYLICRGLVRIYLVSVADQITHLLTKKAVINHGIIQNPSLKLLKSKEPQVLVIGAGVSGLAAASHLKNLGVNVKVFEASSDLGGRVKDVPMLGSGAFLVHGLTNNPFSTLAIQAKAEFQTLNNEYVLFRPNRELVPDNIVKRTKWLLNGFFQGTLESVMGAKEDNRSFKEALEENRKKMWEAASYCNDSEVFDHLLSLKENELKADLKHLSVFNWECTTSLQGGDGYLPNGLRLLLIKLARNVDIAYHHKVKSIDYSSDEIKVNMSDDSVETFSKVLVTVPLSVLQSGQLEFQPLLPDYKSTAISSLNNFYCEKLILEFPKKFWQKNSKKTFTKFGIISRQNVFELFMDITGEKENSIPTLVAIIQQKNSKFLRDRSDKEIVDECMMVLKNVFGKNTAVPSKWFLTHWEQEAFGGSFGSYLKIGSDKSAYDNMATSIDDKLYFAGEATFRNMPSTVTGAYLSGLREAAKIIKDLGQY